MSQNAHNALFEYPEFITEPRGDVFVKVRRNAYGLLENRDFLLI